MSNMHVFKDIYVYYDICGFWLYLLQWQLAACDCLASINLSQKYSESCPVYLIYEKVLKWVTNLHLKIDSLAENTFIKFRKPWAEENRWGGEKKKKVNAFQLICLTPNFLKFFYSVCFTENPPNENT